MEVWNAPTDFSLSIGGSNVPDESVLVQRVREALSRGSRRVDVIDGFLVDTNSNVRVMLGPVVGDVTATTAVILLEVRVEEQPAVGMQAPVFLSLLAYRSEEQAAPVERLDREVTPRRPVTFVFSQLEPETWYTVMLNGVSKHCARTRVARFRTKAVNPQTFRMLAVSCDRPGRLLLGQQNPWMHMLRRIGNVDAILHVGDQIYPDNEDIAHAGAIFKEIYDGLEDDAKRRSMMLRGRELWRNKYRDVWSREGKAEVLAGASNLMIWSDNDVANDFTVMKDETGEQMYHPGFLQCGMRTYREYQRRLWDPAWHPAPTAAAHGPIQEWHAHTYGAIGTFFFDLRGNRVDCEGKQMSTNSLISAEQWADLEAFLMQPQLKVAVLVSETPFLGDEPQVCKDKVAEAEAGEMDFLQDHWPYNEEELVRLLDLCFAWKAEGSREVLFIAGDIHCGVTSVVRDEETGLQINQLTTSPVTNHVCKFFPGLQGAISERYNFSHLPLGRKFRNYADVSIAISYDDVSVQAKLVPISTDIFREDFTWQEDQQED